MSDWYGHHLTPAKVGTMPAAILIHGSDKRLMQPGRWIRIKEGPGDKWHRVFVERVFEDGRVLVSR